MDDVARLSPQDRTELFQEAAKARGDMLPALIEKDFGVYWTLRRMLPVEQPAR